MGKTLRGGLLALLLALAAGTAEAAAPWTQEERGGDRFAVARQQGLELAVGCAAGRLVMTYAVPKAALAPQLAGLAKVYLVLDYDGAGSGLYRWYETRLTDGGEVWLTQPLPAEVLENVHLLAATRSDIRVGLSATEPDIGFRLLHEARIAAKGSQAAVKPALQQCGLPLK